MARLLERLELSGFRISPGDHLRLWQVLQGPGKAYMHEPDRLKYLLAPVVARSAAEQARFYEVFDKWWEEVKIPLTLPPQPEWWQKVPDWLWWLIGSLLVMGIGYAFFRASHRPPPLPPLEVYFEQRTGTVVGDTFSFVNLSPRLDTADFRYEWEWSDDESKRIEYRSDSPLAWTFRLDSLDGSANKTVKLTAYNRQTNEHAVYELPIVIACASAPSILDLVIPDNAQPGATVKFNAEVEYRPGLRYTWSFDEGEPSHKATPSHKFEKNGRYRITLLLEDTLAKGRCITQFSKWLSVGKEKALLAVKPYYKDRAEPIALYSWGMWILMSLLGLAIIYSWIRWAARPAPKPPAADPPIKIEATDKAPYFIPWQAQDGSIRTGRESFRLGDAFRLRQEGLRQSVDVNASVHRTIQKGGYPELRFSYNTRPTEYLFLLDEQTAGSHQARLFKYLVEMLRGQDVHLEHFYYATDFHRFWNRSYPDGIGLDLLQRLYPEYRLVILGDAHGLVDPHAAGQPKLRGDYLNMLRTWRQRLLLTPVPPNSWTYREGLLYSQFALFPADLRGQSEAAVFVESGLDSEDLPPTFSQWQAGQQQQRREPTLNYRKWRTWFDHEDYLRDQPALQLWLKALAVYPTPTWEVTIAIGKALEPMGVKVNFDHLLLLSRIPWLQNGRFDPRLREEMLELLDPQAEQLAREAVRSELEAVREAAGRGHANIALETDLAVQHFAINPDDDSHQEAIRYLLANGLIDRRREAELNQVVDRHTSYGGSVALKGGDDFKKVRSGEDIHSFLEKEKTPPPTQERPFFTPMFWRAVGLSLLFVVLWLIVRFSDGTDGLYRLAFGEKNSAGIVDDTALRNYFFIKETTLIDSVLIYNNQGVDTALAHQDTAAAIYFQRAIAYRIGDVPENIQGKNYALRLLNKQFMLSPLVESNWGKVYYNAAVHDYLDFLNDSLDRAELPRIGALFEKATAFDSVGTDALHGLGLTWFYRDQRDSARHYYDLLVARTDSLFFDTISLLPNLETLLGLRQSRIVSVIPVDQSGDDVYVAVNYYFDVGQYTSLDLELAGLNDRGQLPKGLSATVAKVRPGLQSDTLRLRAPSRLTSNLSIDSLRVRLRAPKSLATVSERVIPFEKTWESGITPASSTTRIEGVIVDAESGKPIRGARIIVNAQSTIDKKTPLLKAPTRNKETVSDINGIFRITLEEPRSRTVTLNISANQYIGVREVISIDRLLKPGYEIALRPIAGSDEIADIQFSFTDNETGRPLTGVSLTLMDHTGKKINSNSGSQSRINQRLKVPENYTVTVTLPGYVEITENLTITKETVSEEYKLIKAAKPLIITNYPTLYFDLDAPARDGLSYNSLYQNYYGRKDEYVKNLVGNSVTRQTEQQIINEVTDFFEKNVRGGFEEFRLFHDQLVNVLENGGTVYLNIWGYGAATGNNQNARTLAERRIKAVEDYILQYDSNNLSRYVQQGRLVFQEENYGDVNVPSKKALPTMDILDQLKECRVEIRAAKSGR